MLQQSAEFPFIGSRGFEKSTARPLTVIQHLPEKRVLCRRDDVPAPSATIGGTAEGNVTLELSDIFGSEAEAFDTPSAKARRARRAARTNALKQQSGRVNKSARPKGSARRKAKAASAAAAIELEKSA